MIDWTASGFVHLVFITMLLHVQPVWTNSRLLADQSPLHTDLARPLRFTVSISESDLADQVVANLTSLVLTNSKLPTGLTADLHHQTIRSRYELLDVSANLLANLPPQRRVNFVQLVQLESHTGVVRFTVPLDRERLCPDVLGTDQRCTISLLIAIHFSPVNTSQTVEQTVYADLTVVVLDENDNAPYFTSATSKDGGSLVVVTVDEESPIGTMIQLPQATDPDNLEHGVQRYEFHPTSTPVRVRDHFDIVQFRHQTGNRCEDISPVQLEMLNSQGSDDGRPIIACLRTIKRLDRETVGDKFHFRLIALDSDAKRGEIAIQVMVRDVNDHAPEWAPKLERFDANGRSHWVSVNPTELDQTGETKQSHYTFSVPECTTQHKLVRLEARDRDDAEQEAGKITFRLSEHNPDASAALRRRFFVSNNHLYLTDRGLRGLAQPNLTVVVIASDGAGKSTEAWFHLRIEDCNDHRPMILMQNTDYIAIPEESLGQSHLISLITVRDFDLVSSTNSEFSCFLNDTTYLELKEVVTGPNEDETKRSTANGLNMDALQHDKPAEFSSRRGRWSVYRLGSRPDVSFDRESGAFYSVTFECVDKGVPALTASRLILIHVEDINDNAPRFITTDCAKFQNARGSTDQSCSAKFTFAVAENAERGALVGSVRAVDSDSGENARLEYALHPLPMGSTSSSLDSAMGNRSRIFQPESLFAISPVGEIHLIGELDRERQGQYRFLVEASDHGKTHRLSSTATVTILVEDVNDCAPVFHGDYVFEVVESYGSSTIHQVLGTLNATDADMGRNGTVHYRLAVHTRDKDRTGLSSPMSSSNKLASQLVKVTHDGQLTIYGVVDREQTPMIMVDVIAEDNGIPIRQSALTTVTIHVLDLNDNKPRFVQPEIDTDHASSLSMSTNPTREIPGPVTSFAFDPVATDATYKLNLSLDTSIGTLLTKFEAIDQDYGPNGTVIFELIYSGGTIQPRTSHADTANTSLSTFTLHPDGRLILTNHLDFDTIYTGTTRLIPRRYRRPDHLLIRVSDQGPSPEHAITGVQIVYFDASLILTESTAESRGPVSMERQTQANFTAFKTSAGQIDRTEPRRRSYPSDSYTHISSKRTHAYSGQGKSHGLPVLYILALAVCFALVLVITSLVYLYFKMRKSNGSNSGAKRGDRTTKQDNTSTKLLPTDNAPNGSIRLDCNSQSCLPEDSNTTSRQNSAMVQLGENGNNMAVAYRTLSSPYLMLNGTRLSPTLTGDSYANEVAQAHWATISPGYMGLLDSVNQAPSFALRQSSNLHAAHVSPNSLFYSSGLKTSSKLDERNNQMMSGSGYDDDPHLYRSTHHQLPACDFHASHVANLNPSSDKLAARSKKSRVLQAELSGKSTTTFGTMEDCRGPKDKAMDCSRSAERETTGETKRLQESETNELKSVGSTDAQKSSGDSTTPLLFYFDRQPADSATPSKSHLTEGSFV